VTEQVTLNMLDLPDARLPCM